MERRFAIVDFLIGDVGNHARFARLADRESTITALPGEIVRTSVLEVSGRAGLEVLDQIGERGIPRKPGKDVDMIFGSTDLKRLALQIAQGAGEIGVQVGAVPGVETPG